MIAKFYSLPAFGCIGALSSRRCMIEDCERVVLCNVKKGELDSTQAHSVDGGDHRLCCFAPELDEGMEYQANRIPNAPSLLLSYAFDCCDECVP